jgi:hypothetical protein
MKSSLRSGRGLRTMGARAGAMVLAVAALLSGCYYRGREPEYGRRDYRHDHDRRYDRDRDHERHY